MITIKTNKLWLAAGAILLAAVAVLTPMDAFASIGATNDLASQTKALGSQVSNIPKLIAVGCYVIGAFFAVRALFSLKGFIEAPDDNPITKVLSFGAVSALLIMLPYIIGVMSASIGSKAVDVSSASTSFKDTGSW